MTNEEIHYLKSILNHLREFRRALPDKVNLSFGSEILSDNIDWLDCYIDANERRAKAEAKEPQ